MALIAGVVTGGAGRGLLGEWVLFYFSNWVLVACVHFVKIHQVVVMGYVHAPIKCIMQQSNALWLQSDIAFFITVT